MKSEGKREKKSREEEFSIETEPLTMTSTKPIHDYNTKDESAESKSPKGFRALDNESRTQTGDRSVRDPEKILENENRPIDKTGNDSSKGRIDGNFLSTLNQRFSTDGSQPTFVLHTFDFG